VVVWLYVVQIENPEFETSVNSIPVTFENEQILGSLGLMVVSPRDQRVNIRFSGKRQVIGGLNSGNITASVNLKDINYVGEFNLPINLSFPVGNITVIDRNPYNLAIKIENISTVTLNIDVVTTGRPRDGFYARQASAAAKTVDAVGAQSVIETVKSAKVSVDVGGAHESINGDYKIELYDKDGNVIDSPLVKLSSDTVNINCDVEPIKQVDVKVDITGVLNASGYVYRNYTVKPDKLNITGKTEVLDGISSINAGTLDLGGITYTNNTKKFTVVLPDNVTSADGVTEVEVTVQMDALVERVVEVGNIALNNVKDGCQAKLTGDKLSVKVMSADDVSGGDFSASADLSGLDKGAHTVPVTLTPKKQNVSVVGNYTAEVVIE